jgi:hypothetical protein
VAHLTLGKKMSVLPKDEIPEDVQSTLARMKGRGTGDQYGLWSRILMFAVIAGVLTMLFGYWFVRYSIGMGMTAGTGSESDRLFGWLLLVGYPTLIASAAYGIFKR